MSREVIDIIIQERGGRRTAGVVREVGTAATTSAGGVQLLRNALRGLGAGFAIREVLRAVDSYQRMQNQLRVTGLETDNLAQAQRRLFDISQRTRTPLEETVNLYGKLSQASGELGKSSAEMLRFTELTGKALAIQGTTVQGTRAALLQLSQAMGEGIVRAQEFNSLIENARPLLLAAAQGMDGAGGSVARLRTMVLAGTVTSKAFFDAVLKGGGILDDQFGKTVPTIGQALTVLRNGWTQFIGESRTGQVLLGAVSGTLIALANNLELVAIATITAGAAFATYFAGPILLSAGAALISVALAAARYATIIAVLTPGLGLLTSAQLALTASTGGLAAAFAVLLSPVGILVAAVGLATAAWLLYGGTSGDAKQAIEAQDRALQNLDTALKDVDQTTAAGIASTKEITTEHYRAARAALEVARAEAKLALQRAQAASKTLNPFDDISALGELQRVYQLLLDSNAAIQGLETRMADFGLSVNASGDVIDTVTGNIVKTAEEIDALNRQQLTFASKMRVANLADLATANQMLTTIRQEAQMQQLVAAYGADSHQVTVARQAAERAVVAEKLRELEVAESVVNEILAAVDSSYQAVNATNAWAGSMSNVASQIRGIVSALASIGGGLIDNASRAVEIKALKAGATVSAAQRARVEADIKAETSARLLGAKTVFERTAILLDQDIKLRGVAQEEELAGLQKIAAARDRANNSGGGGGGGGGRASAAELSAVQDRLTEITQQSADTAGKAAIEQAALTLAYNNGTLSAEQYAVGMQNVRLYSAEAALENTNLAAAVLETNQAMLQLKIDSGDGTFADGFLLGLSRMTEGAINFTTQSGQLFSDYFSSLSDGVSDSIGRAIVYSENLGEALSNVAKEALAGLISGFVKLGIQWLINAAIGKSLQAAAAATTTAQASAAAAAWAPAAALASLATSGANAAPAAAAITATTALSAGIAASANAFADGGEVRGPGGPRDDSILARLSNKEFVVNARDAQANLPLLQAINSGKGLRTALSAFADGGLVSVRNTPARRGNKMANATQRDIASSTRNGGNSAAQPTEATPEQNFVFLQDPDLVGQYMQTADGREAIVRVLTEEGVIGG